MSQHGNIMNPSTGDYMDAQGPPQGGGVTWCRFRNCTMFSNIITPMDRSSTNRSHRILVVLVLRWLSSRPSNSNHLIRTISNSNQISGLTATGSPQGYPAPSPQHNIGRWPTWSYTDSMPLTTCSTTWSSPSQLASGSSGIAAWIRPQPASAKSTAGAEVPVGHSQPLSLDPFCQTRIITPIRSWLPINGVGQSRIDQWQQEVLYLFFIHLELTN
jgi:hypothetical protein